MESSHFRARHGSNEPIDEPERTTPSNARITITPILVADLQVEGWSMPLYVHVIDHPDARVLVDTGMTELHSFATELDPRLHPLSEQDFDLASIDIVVNTHLRASLLTSLRNS